MENMSTSNLAFSAWAKQVNTQHHDILEHMRQSTDPLKRAIAVRIMKNAGVKKL